MMVHHQIFSDLAAAVLLRCGAVQVSAAKPFTLASGKLSPIYFDCRRIISDVAAMTLVAGMFQWLLCDESIEIDLIAGGESAGIPFADRLATLTGKPLIYVRKEAKAHGTRSAIEGQAFPGKRALLVEDMVTDGVSKLAFIKGLRDSALEAEYCLVVLDREQGATAVLKDAGVKLYSLTTAKAVLDFGRRHAALSDVDIESAMGYLSDPEKWSATTDFGPTKRGAIQ